MWEGFDPCGHVARWVLTWAVEIIFSGSFPLIILGIEIVLTSTEYEAENTKAAEIQLLVCTYCS